MDSRFLQANERTLLAWLRTGLGLSAFGFAVAKSSVLLALLVPNTKHSPLSVWLGVLLILSGVIAMVTGLVRYHRVRTALLHQKEVTDSAGAVTAFSMLTILVVLGLAIYQSVL